MISKLIIMAMFLFPDSTAKNQTLQFSLIKSFPTKAEYFTTDVLGNIYTVKKDIVTRYNPNGDSLYSQSFKWLGRIESIDAANALRVFIFYPDLNQVAVLDNTLSLQGDVVKLEKFGFQFVTLLCQSVYYNHLWLYSTEEFKLLRVDYLFQVKAQSANLTQILGYELNPVFITEGDQRVYLSDPENGVHVFDIFGAFIQTLPLKGLKNFQVMGDYLYYLENNVLHAYNLREYNDYTFPLPLENVTFFRVEKKRVFLLSGGKMFIFSVQ